MVSARQNFTFVPWEKLPYQQFLTVREGETRLGEVNVPYSAASFVILGIEESIGPNANLGNSGAENAFEAFCRKFLNMQSNFTFWGNKVGWLGAIRTTRKDIPQNGDSVGELDEFVKDVINLLVLPHQILIVIGGGHNNAYPIIASRSTQCKSPLHVVNLDAHADYRSIEGRHSGNPFSYAYRDGFLQNYSVFSLHKRYNNEVTLSALTRDGHFFTFLEDYIDRVRLFEDDVMAQHEALREENIPVGIELDMDAIENMPSSAVSPSGMTFSAARYFVRQMVKAEKCVYLHLPEGAPFTAEEKNKVGKALSYLVTDFMECHPLSKF